MTATSNPLEPYQGQAREGLRRALAGEKMHHVELIRESVGFGRGKGGSPAAIRGFLPGAICLFVAEALGARPGEALPAAAALDLVHEMALIQTGLGEGIEQGGRQGIAVSAGIPLALNASDAAYALAQLSLLQLAEEALSDDIVLLATARLDAAMSELADATHGHIDALSRPLTARAALSSEEESVLLGAAAALGALISGAGEEAVEALDAFGRGLAVVAGGATSNAANALNSAGLSADARARLDGLARYRIGRGAG